jgi:DNA (cytosine-5-)-methyltransferase
MTTSIKKIKHLDLFSGMGGFSISLEKVAKKHNCEYECIAFSDIKLAARKALANNFPDIKNIGDITKVVPENIEQYDILTAGFPCQPFSAAGVRGGFNDHMGRGEMFFYVANILQKTKPQYFILENVSGLIKHDNGKTLKTILETLTSIGYIIDYHLYNSFDFGLPQKRERVFIYGYRQDENIDTNLQLQVKIDAIKNHKLKTELVERKYFKDIFDSDDKNPHNKLYSKTKQKKIAQFVERLMKHVDENNIYLDDVRIKDHHVIRNNSSHKNKYLLSWNIGVFGETTQEEKDLLMLLSKEGNNKKNNIYHINRKETIPLTVKQIHGLLVKTKNNKDDIINIDNLEKTLEKLYQMGYVRKMFYVYSDRTQFQTNIYTEKELQYKTNINKQNEVYEHGYAVLTNKMRYDYYHYLETDNQATSVLPTITATDVHKIGVVFTDENGKKNVRQLNEKELLRSLGYSDNYNLDNIKHTEVFDLIGNSIPLPVAEYIAEKLVFEE